MKSFDVIVVGGGFAGCAAALAAARTGCSVLLVEKSNALGGAANNCLVNPYMNYRTHIDGRMTELSAGLFRQINDELRKLHGFLPGTDVFSEELLKLTLNRMLSASGVELLFHSLLIGCRMEGEQLRAVELSGKSGRFMLEAQRFIDATGDADLAFLAGCPTHLGRDSDHLCQPMTLCFRVGGVDETLWRQQRADANALYKRLKEEGKLRNAREDILVFPTTAPGVLHFNSTRVVRLNPTDPFDLTRAEIEAREQVYELFMLLKEHFSAFANSTLLSTAAEIGVRESRMIDGVYRLSGADLVACRRFEDSIALGNYDIDIHNPEGSGTSHYYFKDGDYYTIPYRSLLPQNACNLLAAGRCISVDHEAQASIRIMPIVCCIGEAAGAAAGLSLKNGCFPAQLDVSVLQKHLLGHGAAL